MPTPDLFHKVLCHLFPFGSLCMPRVIVCLGANEGRPHEAMAAAIEQLAALPQTNALLTSSLLSTVAVGGPTGQSLFLNAAALLETTLAPQELLEHLQAIEKLLGRKRVVRWGPRTMDLDIALFGDQEVASPTLTIPHPRLAFRPFMLLPATEIGPQMRHPSLGVTLSELSQHLHSGLPKVFLTGSDQDLCNHLQKQVSHAKVTCVPLPLEAFLQDSVPQGKLVIVLGSEPSAAESSGGQTSLNHLRKLARQGKLGAVYWLSGQQESLLLEEIEAAMQAVGSIVDDASGRN